MPWLRASSISIGVSVSPGHTAFTRMPWRPMVDRLRLGHEDHAALRRAVRDGPGAADQTPARRAVDDRAAPLFDHRRQHRARHQERALEARVHLRVPLVLVAPQRVVGHVDAGVVEQHIDPAERLERLERAAGAVLGVANVGPDEDGATARRLDLAGDRGAASLVATRDRHAGAFAGERHRGRPADPGRPAGDQPDLPLEAHPAILDRSDRYLPGDPRVIGGKAP